MIPVPEELFGLSPCQWRPGPAPLYAAFFAAFFAGAFFAAAFLVAIGESLLVVLIRANAELKSELTRKNQFFLCHLGYSCLSLAVQGKWRTNFIRAGPSTSLRSAQDDGVLN